MNKALNNHRRFLFHIHGDNIVECERIFSLIEVALKGNASLIKGPFGNPTNPRFQFELYEDDVVLEFVFFPGFGRWNDDIRHLIQSLGGIIRESVDVILTDATSGTEYPLIGIEYSVALSAGNQAWQRNGRAYSFGLAGVPFLYVNEIGGYELDSQRKKKSIRRPNPAVVFSYVSFSFSTDATVLPIYVKSPSLNEDVESDYNSITGEVELLKLIRAIVLDEDKSEIIDSLEDKAIDFVQMIASKSVGNRTLKPKQWKLAYHQIKTGKEESIVPYLLQDAQLNWSKTAYIATLTKSMNTMMQISSELGIGLASSNLPMCLIPPENRREFANHVYNLYPKLNDDFLKWLESDGVLSICWVMGFKPQGDDARPDRGLPPFVRMLVGQKIDMMTVIYGPAPKFHWQRLLDDPIELGTKNGLWEAIFATSDAILIDSATDDITDHGFLNSHWKDFFHFKKSPPISTMSAPKQIGEHDVDTVIHLLFSRLGQDMVFEGLCNPPGGDWSGISLLTEDRATQLRWLSLPRVSGVDAKRPDHVLEIFDVIDVPLILVVESKDTARSVEPQIGQRLKRYIKFLMQFPANTQKENTETANWYDSNLTLNYSDFVLASAVAFLIRSETDIEHVHKKSNVDLLIGLNFVYDKEECQARFIPITSIGQIVLDFVKTIPISDLNIKILEH